MHSSLDLLLVLRMSWHMAIMRSDFVLRFNRNTVFANSSLSQQGGAMHQSFCIFEVILIEDEVEIPAK